MFRVPKNSLMLLAAGAIVGAVTLQIVTRSVNEAEAAGGPTTFNEFFFSFWFYTSR